MNNRYRRELERGLAQMTQKAKERIDERERLEEDRLGRRPWRKWGPYLSERQWGTVREDYSPHGDAWDYFPHDHARGRAYRWGEDGLAGVSDDEQRLCLSLALWNGRDPILKERLFGLTNSQGNHGEDVKEVYYYLDATPTHSYLKMLYKYPQREFPYARLVDENRNRRSKGVGSVLYKDSRPLFFRFRRRARATGQNASGWASGRTIGYAWRSCRVFRPGLAGMLRNR